MTDEELATRLGETELPIAGTFRVLLEQFCGEFGYFDREQDVLLTIAKAARAALEPLSREHPEKS